MPKIKGRAFLHPQPCNDGHFFCGFQHMLLLCHNHYSSDHRSHYTLVFQTTWLPAHVGPTHLCIFLSCPWHLIPRLAELFWTQQYVSHITASGHVFHLLTRHFLGAHHKPPELWHSYECLHPLFLSPMTKKKLPHKCRHHTDELNLPSSCRHQTSTSLMKEHTSLCPPSAFISSCRHHYASRQTAPRLQASP